MDPAKSEKYMLVDTKTKGTEHKGALKFALDLTKGKGKWKHSRQVSQPALEEDETKDDTSWQQRVSLLLCKIWWTIDGPLVAIGKVFEDFLNLHDANGGLFKLIYRALFKRSALIVRDRESEDYACVYGIADPRFALHVDTSAHGKAQIDEANAEVFPGTDYGARGTADVLVMASKLAYENPAFIKKVVNQTWKMNFVGFYSCWNEYLGRNGTQLFVFTDQPNDARAIVVSFRGTELFSGYDWSTDFDFSWFEVKGLGMVHVGFLEALGLADRTNMETFVQMQNNCNADTYKKTGLPDHIYERELLAYETTVKVVKKLMAQNPHAKLFVTGHSLGGALATIFTTMLYYNKENLMTSKLGALYTFGQPRVGGEEFSRYMIERIGEARYWRCVYNNDLVCRIPFDDRLFQFKHRGLCYFFDASYGGKTLTEAPNPNFFSLTSFVVDRLVAVYELLRSLVFRWTYGPEYGENFLGFCFRLVGILVPGIGCHLLVNYVNAVRLGPSPLIAKLHEDAHIISSWWSRKLSWFKREDKMQ